MSFKNLWSLFVVFISMVAASSSFSQVQLSSGCDWMNDSAPEGTYNSASNINGPKDFFAGELISFSLGDPFLYGQPNSLTLAVNGSEVDSDSYPGTVSYVFPSDGTSPVQWNADTGNATWSISCELGAPIPESPEATPVPVFGIPGALVFALVLLLFGGLTLRRFNSR